MFVSVKNFDEYKVRIHRVSDSDLVDEYVSLTNMLAADIRNSFCVEIMDAFLDIVRDEVCERYIKASEKDVDFKLMLEINNG